MYVLFALISMSSLSVGTFMARSIAMRLPPFQIVGPLFFFNALYIIPIAIFRGNWHKLSSIEYLQNFLVGALTALGGLLFFTVVKRTSASSGIIGQSISPAMVLFIAPFMLGTRIGVLQLLAVAVLISAVIYPVRNVIAGLSSKFTITLMLTQGIVSALISILIMQISKSGVEISQTLIIQQVVAGLILTPIFFPKAITLSDFPKLARRSFMMSMGWFFSFLAFKSGNVIIVQSILAAMPITIVFIESFSYRKRPDSRIVFSSSIIIICIIMLSLFT